MIHITDESGEPIEDSCRCGHAVVDHMWFAPLGVAEVDRCYITGCGCPEYGACLS